MNAAKPCEGRVSVIICAYTEKRWDKISAAIDSIKLQTIPIVDLVLVIDHNPELYRRACQHFQDVKIVENREMRGLSGARNTGLSVAQGELIAFLDDDAIAEIDWLELLCQHLDDEKVLGAGGVSQPDWETVRPAWFPEEFLWVVGCSYLGLPETAAQVRNPFGGCTCWRREIFDTVGDFDSSLGRVGSLPAGCEETEISIRANQHWPDRKFLFIPQAKIRHFVPANRVNLAYFCSRCYAEGVSKARVTQLVGRVDGLSAERSYTFKTLPLGFLRGLTDALRGDLGGLGRACAIFLGLAFTTLGYLVGSLQQKLLRQNHQAAPSLSEK